VTVPTCWYLISNAPDTSHGHEDHGGDHGSKSHGEEHVEEEPEVEPEDGNEKGEEDSNKSEDSDSEAADTPDTSDDEAEDGNTKSSTPDAKGGNKKRIESDKGEKQGDLGAQGGDGEPTDKASTSKEPLGGNSQSSKQEGLSNTDTKHSTDITNNPDKSTKGEGTPESGKAKGTVDPNRPQK